MGWIQRMKERAAAKRQVRRQKWAEAAERVGGELVTPERGSDEVRLPLGPWTLTLDTHVVSNGQSSTTYTRVRSFFRGSGELKLTVRNRNFLDGLWEKLGWLRRYPLGPKLTERYVVGGKPHRKIPSLFSAELTAALLSVPSMRLEVKQAPRKHRKRLGEDAGAVTCETTGVIDDPDRLVGMIAIVGATLAALERTGDARRDLPLGA